MTKDDSEMLERITAKIGMSLEEYARRFREYCNNTCFIEDDNPIPGLPSMSILSMDEIHFATKYLTEHKL